jgi:hypothetical protein
MNYSLYYQALRVIGADYKVLIPPKQRVKGAKLAPRTLPGKVLATLGKNTYQVYIPSRRLVIKTSFLTIKENIEPILRGLQPLTSIRDLPLEGENGLLGLRDKEESLIGPTQVTKPVEPLLALPIQPAQPSL